MFRFLYKGLLTSGIKIQNIMQHLLVSFFSDARAINVTDSGSEDTEAEHKNEFLFKPCDNATEFQCTTSSLCVPKYWLCDGTVSTIKL